MSFLYNLIEQCTVEVVDGTDGSTVGPFYRVKFREPQRAIAPGQVRRN